MPGGLTVVRMAPPGRRAPPVPTAVPIVEPDGARLEALARRSGRELAADAEAELKAARRRKDGLARAHGLEDFVGRYPRHPQADNALVEAAAAYAEAGRADAACTVARRAAEEYPAGDAAQRRPVAPGRLRVAARRRRRREEGPDPSRQRVPEHAGRPRAGERLAAISGRTGGESPADVPARSGP